MPKFVTYLVVKQQVQSFKELGFKTVFEVQGYHELHAPKIRLSKGTKEYLFSDPDWNTVVSQLSKLYGVIKNEKRVNEHLRGNRHVANGNTSL